MEVSRSYYGGTFLKEEDLKETNINHRIELKYYSTIDKKENEETSYGIEIIKKEYKECGIDIESNKVKNISNKEERVTKIIDTLINCKVTPIGLNDVLEDLLKVN